MSSFSPAAALALLALTVPQASAYGPAYHASTALNASRHVCAAAPESHFCAELSDNADFLQYGAIMEDAGEAGFKEVFKGVDFRDEEPEDLYGPCRKYVVAGKNHMYCNHYFFIENSLAGRREGPCGVSIMGATDGNCAGGNAFKWESARQRGLRLWKEKVLPYYFGNGRDDRARAYYWLGRVAHLLADVSVPGHVIPHDLGYVEFEHRVFEDAAEADWGTAPAAGGRLPADLDGLFTGLASLTLRAHGEARAAACREEPGTPGCDAGLAHPSKPLESWLFLNNVRLISALIEKDPAVLSRPELAKERELAGRQVKEIGPQAAAYTVKLLELFGALDGLAHLEAAALPPAADAIAGPPSAGGRSISTCRSISRGSSLFR